MHGNVTFFYKREREREGGTESGSTGGVRRRDHEKTVWDIEGIWGQKGGDGVVKHK